MFDINCLTFEFETFDFLLNFSVENGASVRFTRKRKRTRI